MNPQTEVDFRAHSEQEFPREACGLVIVVKGKERYFPCRNVAIAGKDFVMHADDYAAAEDTGTVIAVAHSHPQTWNRMSDADHVQCNAHGMPWYILSVIDGKAGDMACYEPDDYDVPLVGRQFTHGVLDCYSLIKDYYKRVLDIELPEYERQDDWWNNGDDLYMQHFADAGFAPITGPIQLHDVIIMQVRAPVPNHAAVFIGDPDHILHHMYNRLSTREVYGGPYQEMTRLVVRHAEFRK